MLMKNRTIILLILILLLSFVAIYVDINNSPGIHVAGIERDFEIRQGLDLQGGVQVLLEADLPPGEEIDPQAMDQAARIVGPIHHPLRFLLVAAQQAQEVAENGHQQADCQREGKDLGACYKDSRKEPGADKAQCQDEPSEQPGNLVAQVAQILNCIELVKVILHDGI